MSAGTGGVMACPACGGAETGQVGGAATPFDAEAGETFHQPAYSIRYCSTCGLYFKSHCLPLAALDEYYARLDCQTFEHGDAFPSDRYLRRLLERLHDGSLVLDFGCSTGRLLRPFTCRLRCYGVEPNAPAAAIARNRGIQILTEEQLQLGERRGFNLVILADVYEHLANPAQLIELLVTHLRPGGNSRLLPATPMRLPTVSSSENSGISACRHT